MAIILGSKYAGHDAGVFVLEEGKPPFGLDKERITRQKHDVNFPYEVFDFLEPKLRGKEVITAFSDSGISFKATVRNFDRELHIKDYMKLRQQERSNKKSKSYFYQTLSSIYRSKALKPLDSALTKRYLLKQVSEILKKSRIAKIKRYDHHKCHAVGAYAFSNFDKAISLTLDGWGDFFSSRIFLCDGDKIDYVAGTRGEDSIGLVYTSFTEAMGLVPNSDEGKVEALAAYGNPDNELYNRLKRDIKVKGLRVEVLNKRLVDRSPKNVEKVFKPLIEKYGDKNCAAAIQKVLEEVGVELVRNSQDQLGVKKFCFSGGCFANVIMNLKIFEEVKPKEMFIMPAMSDSGTSQGAAVIAAMEEGMKLKQFTGSQMPYYGPEYSEEDIKKALGKFQDKIKVSISEDWPNHAAELVADGNVIGIYHGKMEYGPRALGNRSILADPRSNKVKDIINNTIKRRAWYQPFCPSVLESERKRLFENSYKHKHMAIAFYVKEKYRDKIPAIMHIDGTARPQFVEKEDNPIYHKFLTKFKKLTNYGIILNTSFNLHGRTIVMTPEDALTDFIDCGLNYLFLGKHLIKVKK